MSSKNLVTVVVTVYNMEKYLERCAASVLAQSFRDFELVFVNDGSTDSSEKIIDRILEKGSAQILKINKPHGGLSSALNTALDRGRGTYILFLDADDYLDSRCLEELVRKAETENLNVVCSGVFMCNERGEILEPIRYQLKNGRTQQRRLSCHGKLYRLDYLRKWGLSFPEGKIYEDNSFNLQALFLSPRVGFLEYVGYYRTVHKDSLTDAVVDDAMLPYEAWQHCVKKVRQENVEGFDPELFDFTFLSLLTYLLFARFRKAEYLPDKKRMLTKEGACRVAEVFEQMVNDYFPSTSINRYSRLCIYRELPLKQKIGVEVFQWFCKRRKLKRLVNLLYR